MYGGSNIIPLRVTGGGTVDIEVTHLGTGRPESALTAMVAIRSGDSVRYEALQGGVGQVAVATGEEASLVVVNTPTTLYQYDAFASKTGDPEVLGWITRCD